MGEKILVGPMTKGLRNDVTPFNIDNDSFPVLVNAYQWRGRVKRKRGTNTLCRLYRTINSSSIQTNGSGAFSGNLFTLLPGLPLKGNITAATNANPCKITSANHNLSGGTQVLIIDVVGMIELNGNTYTISVVDANNFTIGINSTAFTAYVSGGLWENIVQLGASIVFNSISVGTDLFTDVSMNGNLTGSSGGSGTINYYTGNLTLTGAPASTNIQFDYYPSLPVMGLEDLSLDATQDLGLLGFDTTYSYNISANSPFPVNDVTYFMNPSGLPSTNYPSYTSKTIPTAFTWEGQDYQQFESVNYQGSLWATNGINIPFVPANSSTGMQFASGFTTPPQVVFVSQTATTIVVTILNNTLIVGDFVFFNEWTASSLANANTLNFQTGYVINITGSDITIELPKANLATDTYVPGIIQFLTNRYNPNIDCLRYYTGSPTNDTNPITYNKDAGWVNFMPPLSNAIFSISDIPQLQYYLVGAIILLSFKDRLIAIGPVVQASSGNPIYLQDTVVYSQNGTPYYTASFEGPITPKTIYTPYLVPVNQTSTANSWWGDQTGLGGWISAGFSSPIYTASPNEDVIIMGFGNRQARFAYTGSDILPFQFFVINSELGSGSTHGVINLDRGVLTMGRRGIIQTSQIESKRIDLDVPDQIFKVDLLNQGAQRICAARDFRNEWIYFTYNSNDTAQDDTPPVYPTQTLQYNYRDQTWGIFNESYTTYGSIRQTNGLTWSSVGLKFPTWSDWEEPWDSSQTTALQPIVIGGNTQGFVLQRGIGTSEAPSLSIDSIDFSTSIITSVNHCLNTGDYFVILSCAGTIGSVLNGVVFQVASCTNDTILLNPPIPSGSYTYLGLGTITRMYIPFIASKAFPIAWSLSRKTRLGPQMYLFTNSSIGQVTLYIYLSQNYATLPGENAYNYGAVVPAANPINNALIYSTIIFTSPESTNIGLTPANTNLSMLSEPGNAPNEGGASPQQQIWHRINTSLIGDVVQIAITLSDAQMQDPTLNNQFAEIELHGIILDCSPSQVLC